MKKSIALFLFLTLFLPWISAVEFEMGSDFSQGETLLAKISGNFFEPISENDILFFREHTRISIIPFVEEIDNDFYIYAQLLGKQPGNYSIKIENAKYYQGIELIERDIEKNFTITENSSDFSIAPGFILTKKDFFIEVQNLKDSQITINYKILNESSSESSGGFFDSLFGIGDNSFDSGSTISVKSGEIKKINFDKNIFTPFMIQKIRFSTDSTKYDIPVFISLNKTENLTETKPNMKFEPTELNVTIPLNSKTSRIVYLFNLGEDLENIELLLSDSLKQFASFSITNISLLEKNESEKIEINFYSNKTEEIIEGQIKAKTQDDFYEYVSVSLNFVKNYQPVNESDLTIPSCSEKNGSICDLGQKCLGDSEVARNGICCLGTCVQEEKSSAGKMIGWGIFILIIFLLIWFYFKKYRKVKNVVDLLKVARGK